jgi:hypothetical protein
MKYYFLFGFLCMMAFLSCKKKTCPTYNTPEENQKIEQKNMKKARRKSAKLF